MLIWKQRDWPITAVRVIIFERQVGRWSRQYRASELQKIDAMDSLIAYLEANIPADDGQVTLVHGDFRLDNVMYAKDNSRLIAVLDWGAINDWTPLR